jgi:hypothetical protein
LRPATGWNEDFIPENGIRPARYEDGVFLTAGQHKGLMLKDLIEKTGSRLPTTVLMLDDKFSNLDAMIETFTELDITVRAWRYAGEDAAVANFNKASNHEMLQSVLPALIAIQEQLGTGHYELPENLNPSWCNP